VNAQTQLTLNRRRMLSAASGFVVAPLLAACAQGTPPAQTAAPAQPTAAPTVPPAQPTAAPKPTAAPTIAPAVAPTTVPATAAPATAAPATAAPATAAPAKAAPVTLRMTDWFSWMKEFTGPIADKTNIQVTEEVTPYPDYWQKLLTSLVAGTGPDMMAIDANYFGDFFPSGLLVPFDDYLKTRKDIDPAKWNVDQAKENGYAGKTYGLSYFTMEDMMLFINKDLADKDGLLKDVPVWGAPNYDTWHWDKWVEWLKAGTKVKNDGTVEQYGLGEGFGGWGDTALVFAIQNGGQVLDDPWGYQETKTMIDQPPFLEAIQFIADLILKHKVAPSGAAETAIQGGSYRAKRALASMTWTTPSIFPESAIGPQAYAHLPFSKNKVHAVGANCTSVNKASKYVDAGLEWATEFCLNRDIQQKFLADVSVPSYDPLPIVQAASDGPGKTIGLINLSRIPGMSSIPSDAEGVVLYPRFLGRKAPAFIRDTLSAALQSIQVKNVSVKDALTEAKQKCDAEIAKKK
jgi:maltose-binding protein MalE